MQAAALYELRRIVGPAHVRTDDNSRRDFGRDWTRWHTPNPSAVVFPGSDDDVVAVVQWARRNHVAIVPSGGRTGLSGGAVAANGEVVLSMGRMNRCDPASKLAQTVSCQSGATIAQVRDAAAAVGLIYPVEFAPMDTMQVGGNIATNAGGVRVVRYGSTRRWVAGVTAVLGTGQRVTFGGPTVKNNAGYDLLQLLIGSEGTLGVITGAVLRLAAPPRSVATAYASADTIGPLLTCYSHAASRADVLACEIWDTAAQSLSTAHIGVPDDLPKAAWHMLLELDCPPGDARGLLGPSARLLTHAEAAALWNIRLGIGGSVAPFTPYKNDIAVPVAALEEFVNRRLPELAATHAGCRLVVWGHLGDGNLHINFLKPPEMAPADFARTCRSLDDGLFAHIAACGGSISAEHGIGLTKTGALRYSRSPEEIALMRQIKSVFDPDGILNPGKVLA